ncbi:hypothetical protein [Marivita sp. S2033]|uniref:hypothetical protein n=1 Tax=Marivita sp. S2033 TaxID=3373187 RepID=UPI003982420D
MPNTKSTADQIKDRASELADDAKEAVTDTAREEAKQARDSAIHQADATADAARAAGSEFDQGSIQAAAMQQLGNQIENVASALRDKPVDEMFDDVVVFARKNPLLFLGGAAILGFAAARFMKSGNAAPRSDYASSDPWAGYLDSDSETY